MTWNWIGAAALASFAIIQILSLRGAVRLAGAGAENAWDNALAYLVASGLVVYFPARWLVQSDALLLTVLAPLVVWTVQTLALRVIYQTSTARAWLIGVTHAALAGTVTGALAFASGVVAAYVLYGKIIADPLEAVRALLRLIGIVPPI